MWRKFSAWQVGACWRGMIRPQEARDAPAMEVPPHGLENLPAALHPLLATEETAGTTETPQRHLLDLDFISF